MLTSRSIHRLLPALNRPQQQRPLEKVKKVKVNIFIAPLSRQCHRRDAQVHGAYKQRRTYLPLISASECLCSPVTKQYNLVAYLARAFMLKRRTVAAT